jgi:long-chain acyl-CoA synthetase
MAMNPTRMFDFIDYQKENCPQKAAFSYRDNGKTTLSYSTDEVIRLANKVSRGLLKMGLKPGDKIGTIVVKNRPEWVVLDLGMMQIGVVNVPVYPTISYKDYEYIFNDSEIKLCFIGDDKAGSVYQKLVNARKVVPSITEVYTFDKTPNAAYWELDAEIERIKATIKPNDLATLIYTSGTTGEPKGVMLSHENMVSNIKAVRPIIPMNAGERSLSFLPLNHIFERVCSYAYIYIGAEVTFTGVDNLGGDEGDLKAVKPHFFTTVPRLLEKVYEKIYNKGLELTGAKRALFFWAMGLTNDYEYDKTYSGFAKIKRNIANKLIFSKWREALGGSIKGIIVGASPCPVRIARTFSAAGIPIREGYGMTETSPGICIGRFDKGYSKLGYVGTTLDGVEMKIDNSDGGYAEGEGEILASGPNVMLGYYNKAEETAKVIKYFEGKRWMCTGDIGKIDVIDGIPMLKITDRKKELFKTSGGKYVAPAPIENKLKESYLIEQIMVVGDNQKFVSALIVPAVDALKDYCKQNNLNYTSLAEILKDKEVLKRYAEIVEKYNPNFSHVEQVKEFRLIADSWEAVKLDGSAAELTPTMKLKRRVIVEKYRHIIDGIYNV